MTSRLHPYRDLSTPFVSTTLVVAVGTYLQARLYLAVTHSYHPRWFAWVLMASTAALAATVIVRIIQQFTVYRRWNASPFMTGLALLAGWYVLRFVLSSHGASASMGIHMSYARAAVPAFILGLPYLAYAALALAALCFVTGRPMPTLERHGGGKDGARTKTKTATPPTFQPAQQTSEPGPAERWPAQRPRYTFADVHGNDGLKTTLRQAAREFNEKGRNGILLSGPPGTGKTMVSEALAGELGFGFLRCTFGDAASKWVNQTTEHSLEMFKAAVMQQPVILFMDEAESVLSKRDGPDAGTGEYARTVSALLTRIADLHGTRVLLVAATNYLDRVDEAAKREGRFDFKIEVPLPDAAARRFLIQKAMAGGNAATDDDVLNRLVRRWAGFNVPRIQLATSRACEAWHDAHPAPVAASKEKRGAAPAQPVAMLVYDDFYRALRAVQGHEAGAPEGAKKLSEMYLDPHLRSRVQDIATQLSHVDEIENMGGTIPKGILFYGPPGTGKTATAMALAGECGWSFIQRRGRDLMQPGAVDALRKEASDLRPAIVFLDEADDILANREYSGYKSATNELLTLVDGAGGMLPDVVWIAATNHRDAIDSAALRGGRFEQKIDFEAPSHETMTRLILDWANANTDKFSGAPMAWARGVAKLLAGQTPANAYSVLRLANNMAVTANVVHGEDRAITYAQVESALREAAN